MREETAKIYGTIYGPNTKIQGWVPRADNSKEWTFR